MRAKPGLSQEWAATITGVGGRTWHRELDEPNMDSFNEFPKVQGARGRRIGTTRYHGHRLWTRGVRAAERGTDTAAADICGAFIIMYVVVGKRFL